ncbi:MAG TPA: transposase [Chloroflexota bacterium]
MASRLREYHNLFAPLFRRAEQRRWSLSYLSGLLRPDLGRKSIEHMARALPDGNVQALQQFIGVGAWDDEEILDVHQRLVAETIGDEPSGVLVVCRLDFAKQGSHSVGVSRQPSDGALLNCQSSLIACYASRRGCVIVDRRLFMPEQWFSPAYEERRRRCGVPPALRFRSRSELARDMIHAAERRRALPFRLATVDPRVEPERRPSEPTAGEGLVLAASAAAAAAIQEAIDRLGMADYEVRGWVGWHHHMTMTALAHHFLVRQRRRGEDA